jgi:hypothetical protein
MARNNRVFAQGSVFEDELSDMLDLYDEPERERITRLCYELLDNLLDLTQSESKELKQAAFMAVAFMSDSLKEKFAKVSPPPLFSYERSPSPVL